MKVKLIQTGGLSGKKLSCESDLKMPAEEIITSLKKAVPEKNPHMRDAMNLSLTVDEHVYPFDISKLDAKLQKVIEKMMDQLKPEK